MSAKPHRRRYPPATRYPHPRQPSRLAQAMRTSSWTRSPPWSPCPSVRMAGGISTSHSAMRTGSKVAPPSPLMPPEAYCRLRITHRHRTSHACHDLGEHSRNGPGEPGQDRDRPLEMGRVSAKDPQAQLAEESAGQHLRCISPLSGCARFDTDQLRQGCLTPSLVPAPLEKRTTVYYSLSGGTLCATSAPGSYIQYPPGTASRTRRHRSVSSGRETPPVLPNPGRKPSTASNAVRRMAHVAAPDVPDRSGRLRHTGVYEPPTTRVELARKPLRASRRPRRRQSTADPDDVRIGEVPAQEPHPVRVATASSSRNTRKSPRLFITPVFRAPEAPLAQHLRIFTPNSARARAARAGL